MLASWSSAFSLASSSSSRSERTNGITRDTVASRRKRDSKSMHGIAIEDGFKRLNGRIDNVWLVGGGDERVCL